MGASLAIWWSIVEIKNQFSMSAIHDYLIETLFFEHIDRGVPAEETPLLMGTFNEKPLEEFIANRFSLSPTEVEAAIEAARQEVVL